MFDDLQPDDWFDGRTSAPSSWFTWHLFFAVVVPAIVIPAVSLLFWEREIDASSKWIFAGVAVAVGFFLSRILPFGTQYKLGVVAFVLVCQIPFAVNFYAQQSGPRPPYAPARATWSSPAHLDLLESPEVQRGLEALSKLNEIDAELARLHAARSAAINRAEPNDPAGNNAATAGSGATERNPAAGPAETNLSSAATP